MESGFLLVQYPSSVVVLFVCFSILFGLLFFWGGGGGGGGVCKDGLGAVGKG